MEFHEKLQALRRQRGLTQQELADQLFVSRTAVSKWESGRGYPNLDSLADLAKLFGVTIDELLTGNDLLTVAEEDQRRRAGALRALLFGLLDVCLGMLYFLPLFGEHTKGGVVSVSLFRLAEIAPWVRGIYCAFVTLSVVWGIFLLAIQVFQNDTVLGRGCYLSVFLGASGLLLFTVSKQPYAAVLLLVFLSVKVLVLLHRR